MEENKMKMKKRLFNTLLATALVAVTVVTGFVHPETAKAEQVPYKYSGGQIIEYETIDEDVVPIYRLYNDTNGEHLYTSDMNEDIVLYQNGWGNEGTPWLAPADGTPVYRLYNSGLNNHLYTKSLLANSLKFHHTQKPLHPTDSLP